MASRNHYVGPKPYILPGQLITEAGLTVAATGTCTGAGEELEL